jgi:formamidopyrimidine-DNA glycosylase
LLTAPAPTAELTRALKGRKITGVSRRGKYLRIELTEGDSLVLHLRMTGIITCIRPPLTAADKKYLRLTIELDDGTVLAFQDSRRFGKALILAAEESDGYWKKLGPEPLDRSFNSRSLGSILENRKRPIKPTLLDQQLVAGIGNIYADEALFDAKLHPERPAGSISGKEISALTKSIKHTLRRAIRLQGSSIDSYRDALGNRGQFQDTFDVHRRAGEPCHRCGTSIKKIRVGGRGTYFCPSCQKK